MAQFRQLTGEEIRERGRCKKLVELYRQRIITRRCATEKQLAHTVPSEFSVSLSGRLAELELIEAELTHVMNKIEGTIPIPNE